MVRLGISIANFGPLQSTNLVTPLDGTLTLGASARVNPLRHSVVSITSRRSEIAAMREALCCH